ncbi:hypothetical protein KOR42_51320 [Thalassoglobus neptunius]|uniref:Uncharacterized protein n=1 Tax=Thalassoglobus neptunius TaxID=1938619 RepID=A0A5C5VP13_9PLAN|nr:hypothetical protein KOR42_51320 [Thalassoglobus neptunius]
MIRSGVDDPKWCVRNMLRQFHGGLKFVKKRVNHLLLGIPQELPVLIFLLERTCDIAGRRRNRSGVGRTFD